MSRRPAAALRALGRTTVVLAAAVLALLGVGTPAALAHDALVATTPADDATLTTPPAQVELQLSGPPQGLGTQVVVTAPDGAVVSQGEPELRGSTVVQPLADGLPAGAYTVAWRVTSSDGHPLSGTAAFTVAGSAADPAPAPEAAAPSEAAAARPVGSSSSGAGWIAAGAAAVVLAAGLVVLRSRRRA
ncbi:copper resistance CopC family protein [Geodermatophilus sp. DSM 45219]|uniref:copper resistance CopC family protein n=1 Tax=Geodermatophilus sp. DSM 45219 TaxID=1881103 RepID=UPI000B873263|nr:copper resistance CopC family protein [Geodermatophilus sp. DSM 45219]